MFRELSPEQAPYDPLIQTLCAVPYRNRPQGCPNLGRRIQCTGKRPTVEQIFDPNYPWYLIWSEYPIGEVAERIKNRHPKKRALRFPQDPKRAGLIVANVKGKLRATHPDWPEEYYPLENTPYEAVGFWYNPRYWQQAARSQQRKAEQDFLKRHPHFAVDRYPEGHGVNVTGTMSEVGVTLDWRWPPIHNVENVSYRVSVAGVPRSPEQGGFHIDELEDIGVYMLEP